MSEITASTVLPARREPITLRTSDGLSLVGELALPPARPPVATLICLHPLPTAGGMMDSHILRKAAYRLPALADLAVLRFNTRGTTSERGTSEGEFGGGDAERHDIAAAIDFAVDRDLPVRWLVGWSFGTELALRWGCDPDVAGAILLSPPLRRAGDADLDAWARSRKPLLALVPGARRLPAARRGQGPLRPGAAGRGGGGRGRQAPVGGGALHAGGAQRDRAPGQPGRLAAAHGGRPGAGRGQRHYEQRHYEQRHYEQRHYELRDCP